ncbi:MAG: SGNH/GDSL hydrolase family protein [Rhodospirillaceae bacterium]|nr:SGNH/GDSL hydrolase family protein [Rhodospirillaceae bacterium]MDD9925055.1 SGNH/GDSL hydrolase family protein [Rhodospirillaceae bacterium]
MPGRREIVLIAASILFAGLLAEISLRAIGIAYPIFHRLETLRGWSPQPGLSGVWMTEGEALIENNREGFRDRDHPLEKPAGAYRIAILGDSMSEALAVPREKTYWSILEDRLAACRGGPVDVMNFSVSGYGTAQQLLTLRHNVLKYSPDLVLLAFFTGNDVWNNERALDGHEDRVYFVLKDGQLSLDDSNTQTTRFQLKKFWRGTVNAIINASRLFQLFREFYTRTRNATRSDAKPSATVFNPESADYAIFKAPETAAWRNAWATTEALLRKMRDETVSAGSEFKIVNLTAPAQVYPDSAVRRGFAKALGVDGLDYPDQRVAALAQGAGIPAISLVEPLRAYADQHKAYLHGFENTRLGTGHWNETGHRLAGETIARTLCANRDN